MNQVEINRLLHNLVRPGVIAEVDHGDISVTPPKPARVRVFVGAMKTDWIPWREQRAGKTRTWNPPTEGEQVLLLTPGGELRGATVLTGINSDHIPAPSDKPEITMLVMPDGAVLQYDHDKMHLDASLPGTATINAKGAIDVTSADDISINAKNINITAQATVSVSGARIDLNQ
ncbi:phage baseplate assembly protein V [Halomonas organivorans]|uniref:Phage baseplate assembly protein V n=1 Tax=Halomonas organivorans TaxID=257772 RepID=A0A7W5BZS0_9GAMM|nr:phage baseplate assembly protein V [Halomonas organivorans]MBB3141208.1 phage baseplate assembly protein V [Halomonas organivorans]